MTKTALEDEVECQTKSINSLLSPYNHVDGKERPFEQYFFEEISIMTVEEIFSECFNIPVSDVTDDIKYQEIEKWDSLNHLRFTAKLEEIFDIELDMDEITDMSSVKKIKEILKGHGIN